jgi:hypothetical protein
MYSHRWSRVTPITWSCFEHAGRHPLILILPPTAQSHTNQACSPVSAEYACLWPLAVSSYMCLIFVYHFVHGSIISAIEI